MKTSEKQLNYSKKYLEKFDDIKIRVPKGKREEWKKIADNCGLSLNQFIIQTISEKIEKEQKK